MTEADIDRTIAYVVGIVVGILLAMLAFIAHRDFTARKACDARTCVAGRPMLVERLRCVCVTEDFR